MVILLILNPFCEFFIGKKLFQQSREQRQFMMTLVHVVRFDIPKFIQRNVLSICKAIGSNWVSYLHSHNIPNWLHDITFSYIR